ncbi:hypothetical protein Klosneuvirus_2_57 [Klosneuvirus KNV1]|uniref:Uncharacterized protein n=1 Tax=Klosneuvirus KNV1 TaxID=1977640 RepID=A0A1V0SIY3_9VIRU|nr:hypothetical protein Klosneuvirus_2_57 [Klosneuvirus KNV1]
MFEDLQAKINPMIVILAAFIIVLCLFVSYREPFTDSGLAISNDYCTRLADVYYRPDDSLNRDDYRNKICGGIRREIVDKPTGNYYTVDGQII